MPSAETALAATSAASPAASASDGQTCASATPNAGGSAVSRSVTVSGWKRPSTENAFTVTSGPSASSSTSAWPFLDSARARVIAASSSATSSTRLRPRWPCRSGALTTQGTGRPSSGPETRCQAGCGTPAVASRSRWRALEVARTAVAGERGCAIPHPLRDPRRDRDGPVDARRDDPVHALRLREPLNPALVLGRDDRPPVGDGEPRRGGVPVERDDLEVAARPSRLDQPELRRPGAQNEETFPSVRASLSFLGHRTTLWRPSATAPRSARSVGSMLTR